MHTPSRPSQWSDTVLMLLWSALFFLPLALVAFFLLGFGGLGSNGGSVEWVTTDDWVFPAMCALDAVVSMAIAIRIVVRHRA